jgi:hypothetical protein
LSAGTVFRAVLLVDPDHPTYMTESIYFDFPGDGTGTD